MIKKLLIFTTAFYAGQSLVLAEPGVLTKDQMLQVLPALSQKIKDHPNDVQLIGARGFCYQQLGMLDTALSDYDLALELQPNSADLHCNRCALLIQLKQYQRALADAEVAVKSRPDAVSYTNRGSLFVLLNRFPEAVRDYSAALRLDSAKAEPYSGLGEIAFKTKHFNDAIAYCNRALYLDSHLAEAQYYRGMSFAVIGKKAESKRDLDAANAAGYQPGEPFFRIQNTPGSPYISTPRQK